VLGGLGVSIVSTPKGVMTGAKARRAKVGGELLALVW
jgi:small subunit ribosomal protein S8